MDATISSMQMVLGSSRSKLARMISLRSPSASAFSVELHERGIVNLLPNARLPGFKGKVAGSIHKVVAHDPKLSAVSVDHRHIDAGILEFSQAFSREIFSSASAKISPVLGSTTGSASV